MKELVLKIQACNISTTFALMKLSSLEQRIHCSGRAFAATPFRTTADDYSLKDPRNSFLPDAANMNADSDKAEDTYKHPVCLWNSMETETRKKVEKEYER